MANGILKQLNRSLELTLRDSLDGLEEFTLMMAYASPGESFEILSIDRSTEPERHPTKPASLTVLKPQARDNISKMSAHRQQKKSA